MTTLPQSTALRLPRPSAPAPMTLAPASAAPMLAGSAGPQLTPADIRRVLRSNALLIAILVIAGAVGGYFLNGWLKAHDAHWTSYAMLEVDSPMSYDPVHGAPTTVDVNMMDIEMRTQESLLTDHQLYSIMLTQSDDVRNSDWFHSFKKDGTDEIEAAKKDLDQNLSVNTVLNTRLLRISMAAGNPDDARLILHELVETHIHNQEMLNRTKEQDRSQLLENLRNTYEANRREKANDVRDLASRLNITETGTAGSISTKDIELNDAIREQMEARLALANAQDESDTLNTQLQQGMELPQVSQQANADPDVMRYRQTLTDMDLEMGAVESSYGADHPVYQQFQKQHAEVEQKLADAISAAKASAQLSLQQLAAQKLAEAKRASDSSNDRVDALRKDMGELSSEMFNYLNAKDNETVDAERIKQIDAQLDEVNNINQQKDLAGVTWKSPPDTAQLTFPQLKYTMPAAVILALALGLGIAFARELMDTTVRSPRDITRVGHLNMLGMVPHEADDPQTAGASLPLVIFEAPHSMMAEQLRQVRTRLQHAASLDTTRSILITSPSPDDGKSTIACNLASGLALNGRRILLVDANFRKPQLHRIFGVANDRGFSDVLNSVEAFEESVQETAVPNLYVLPSGLKPTNATELLESQLLIDFIERALEEFDHVIFDSGPLLFVSETVALAPRVDGVISVVRARINSRGVLQRMRDTLRQVKAEHLGVVLNAVRTHGGGYYGRNIRTYYAYQDGRQAS
jgi:polysaccharide biosynthesis transport protein